MLLADVVHLDPLVSLVVVASILTVAVLLSLRMRHDPLPEQAAVPVDGGPFETSTTTVSRNDSRCGRERLRV